MDFAEINRLSQALGEALNKAIGESEDVRRAVDAIRAVGGIVYLVCQAEVSRDPEYKEEKPAKFDEQQFIKQVGIKIE